jgi:hypothetical protein
VILFIAAEQVQDARRQPRPRRSLNQRRMQRMPEPDAVQSVPDLAGPDQPGSPVACGYCGVETGSLLKTGYQLHGERGFPGPAGLNRRTGGREQGCDQRS